MMRRAHGFTLLEVLLAVVLLALLIAGAYSGISASAHAMRAGEAAIDRTDRLRTVQQFLRRQISHVLPLMYARDEANNSSYVFDGSAHSMRFVAPMPGYLGHGGPYVQTLQLVPGKDGLQLQFSDVLLNGYDAANAADGEPVVLLEHIADGRFEYRSIDAQGNLTDWTSAWPDPALTPLMVRIDLTMRAGTQMPWPTLDVALMLNAGAARPFITPAMIRAGGGAL